MCNFFPISLKFAQICCVLAAAAAVASLGSATESKANNERNEREWVELPACLLAAVLVCFQSKFDLYGRLCYSHICTYFVCSTRSNIFSDFLLDDDVDELSSSSFTWASYALLMQFSLYSKHFIVSFIVRFVVRASSLIIVLLLYT